MLQRIHSNIHVYNMRSRINVNVLRPDFARYSQTTPSANCKLNSSKNLVVSESDFKRFSSFHAEDMMMRSVLFYLEIKSCQSVNCQATRLSVSPFNPYPALSLKNVHGIMCFSRENVQGGLLEVPSQEFTRELVSTEMIILMDNTKNDITLSKLITIDNHSDGYLDILLFRDLNNINIEKVTL